MISYMNTAFIDKGEKMDNKELLRKIAVEFMQANSDESIEKAMKALARLFIG